MTLRFALLAPTDAALWEIELIELQKCVNELN